MRRYECLSLVLGAVGLVALVLILAAGCVPAAHAAGTTFKVPDDYPTIQGAIDAAGHGDTILVAQGTYTENLSVATGLTLSGGWNVDFTSRVVGTSIIDGDHVGRVISITCSSSDTVVTVDGFTVQNGDASGLGLPAMAKLSASDLLPAQAFDQVLRGHAMEGTPGRRGQGNTTALP